MRDNRGLCVACYGLVVGMVLGQLGRPCRRGCQYWGIVTIGWFGIGLPAAAIRSAAEGIASFVA